MIVNAAAQLFARQGYHATTTREIANLADVSENTLFRHFDNKETIFWTALRSHTTRLKPRGNVLDGIRNGDVPEVVLPKILELLIDAVTQDTEVLRLIAVACLELEGKAEMLLPDLLSPIFSEISNYLAVSVEKGEVLEVDPLLLTLSLMAMVLMHSQLSKLTDGSNSSQTSNQNAVRECSKFWLDVLSPRLPSSSASVARRVGTPST